MCRLAQNEALTVRAFVIPVHRISLGLWTYQMAVSDHMKTASIDHVIVDRLYNPLLPRSKNNTWTFYNYFSHTSISQIGRQSNAFKHTTFSSHCHPSSLLNWNITANYISIPQNSSSLHTTLSLTRQNYEMNCYFSPSYLLFLPHQFAISPRSQILRTWQSLLHNFEAW